MPPLGVYDPLGLIERRDMRRYEIMEIKHAAPPCGFHAIHIEAGVRFPGYLSGSAELKFTDVPAGLIASLEAVPNFGWLQIPRSRSRARPATPAATSRSSPSAGPRVGRHWRRGLGALHRGARTSSTWSATTAARR